jgi:SAM-dependent methyltransferase
MSLLARVSEIVQGFNPEGEHSPPPPSPEPFIDVRELMKKFSIAELNESAEVYWQHAEANPRIRAKPFNLGDLEHTLPQIGFLVQGLRMLPGMTVLDFGAGSCFASRMLNQLGMQVISVDVSRTALGIGRELDARWPPVGDVPPHRFSVFDGVTLDVPTASVDRVFCLDAFHHVPDQRSVLAEMARVLREGGIAGFCEPGPHHSRSPESQFEMRNSKVIENDIVLGDIFEHARSFGFTEMKVAAATVHPPLVPLAELGGYFDRANSLVEDVRHRTTNYPIFFLYKGEPRITDSRDGADLRADLKVSRVSLRARQGEPVRVSVDVTNTSPKTWLPSGASHGCVNLGGMLERTGRGLQLASSKEFRFGLSQVEVPPGGKVLGVEVKLEPLEPGDYVLQLDLVSEYVCWFGASSNTAVRVALRVDPHSS